jgi:hypothetical protein
MPENLVSGTHDNLQSAETRVNNQSSDRDKAYLTVLHCGLVMLRNLARSGQIDLCRIEAEHLHEIPTLLGELNEGRHEYYLRGTRELYLESLRELSAGDYLESANIWYFEPWRELESIFKVRHSEKVE